MLRAPVRAVLTALLGAALVAAADMPRPRSGKVEIMRSSELKAGMQATAWTVFQGTEPEAVPIEIIGLWKNQWGPKQDIILGKMGGKAIRTNVAGGMSGSPVYINGKLIGAVALRLSVFSPDAICGITPIEEMLEINDFDKTKPVDARSPGSNAPPRAAAEIPGDLLPRVLGASAGGSRQAPLMIPVETPISFGGFHPSVLEQFGATFNQMGFTTVQGGAAAMITSAKPVAGWQKALQPGDAVSGVLVSGDMSMTGLGTVTYNDGSRVLAFGHAFFNLGPVDMPMTKGEILTILASQFQPNKFGNATEVVGALRQDRHSGIMGILGAEAPMVPVEIRLRSLGDKDQVVKEKNLKFNVFVQQKWTPFLMMLTMFNSISSVNEMADEATYRMTGNVEFAGGQKLSIGTMQSPTEAPVPAPMLLAGWWGDKFNRIFLNSVEMPKLKSVKVTLDLIPERRTAAIESAWCPMAEVAAGAEVPLKVFLRPYRGDRIQKDFRIRIPENLPRGEHRILFSDADTLNRIQTAAGFANRYMDVPQLVSLFNQERTNNKVYVSIVENRATAYSDDKALPSLPQSVLAVMQAGRNPSRPVITSAETATERASAAFDYAIAGSQSLRIFVK